VYLRSIFFIDDRVQDKQALFSTIDASAKWFVLDSSLDGISQMQRILSSYSNLESIQIISHGSIGAINIGSTALNSTNLPHYQTQLQDIGSSLKETGDLLLYGCDVAKGDEGQKFINDLAKVTGADVAASNDLTGTSMLGGNLTMETSTGRIETAAIQPIGFNNVLATGSINGTSGNNTLTGTAGNDTINGYGGNDSISGAAGDDSLDGGTGNDTLLGGANNDTYILWQSGVTTSGSSGADTITDASGTADILQLRAYAGGAFDLYRSGTSLMVRNNSGETTTIQNFTTSAGTAGTGAIEKLQYVNGETGYVSEFNLALGATGGTGNDWVVGKTTNDTLTGSAGNDVLQGDAGVDSLDGGAGDDVLVGGTGNDTLLGGANNDTYILWQSGVTTSGSSGADTITDASGTADILQLRAYAGGAFDLYRSGTSLMVRNNSGETTTIQNFTTSAGTAGTGAIEKLQYVNGETGYVSEFNLALGATGGTGNDWVVGKTTNDTLTGSAGNDVLQGDAGVDSLDGGAGDDVLVGGTGNDTLLGGANNDTYILWQSGVTTSGSSGADTITDASGTADILQLCAYAGGAFDLYRSGTSLMVRNNSGETTTIQNFTTSAGTAGTGAIEKLQYVNGETGYVSEFNLALGATGGTGNDWVVGKTTNDTLTGSAGNDVLQGDAGVDSLDGGAGDDVLVGGTGNDTLLGGANNDTYILWQSGVTTSGSSGADTITDASGTADILQLRAYAGGAFDLYRSGTSLMVRNNSGETTTIQNFTTSAGTAGTGAIEKLQYVNGETGYVSEFNLALGATGGTGNDWVVGKTTNDTLTGSAGNDVLQGDAGVDSLDGGAGDDVLVGGTGNDTLLGGANNDTYILWQSGVTTSGSSGADTITDASGTADILQLRAYAGGAFDLYRSGTSLMVRNNSGETTTIQNFTTSAGTAGTGAIEKLQYVNGETGYVSEFNLALGATGGTGNDWVVGKTTNDTLTGSAGNDVLQGDAGVDSLDGGAGDDVLVGGTGNDTLLGGANNDTYILWQSGVTTSGSSGADTITDASGTADILQLCAYAGGAFDLYRSGTSLMVRNNSGETTTIQNFTTSAGTAGTGAIEKLQYVNGETGYVSEFNLALGATGGTGNDWVVGKTTNDTLTGSAGNDVLQGDAGVDSLDGGAGDDVLVGGTGNDTLLGGLGNDTLSGGIGNDVFVFNTAIGNNVDTIVDFTTGSDKIQLSKSIFANAGATGNLTNNAFWSAAGAVKGHDADDRVVYNTTTGALYYDADGSGSVAAVQIAILGTSTHPATAYTDFAVIA
jgi:trimeric autotransporter adhesin